MNKRKYLKDNNLTPILGSLPDDREKQWKKERKKYGFDERETWDLGYTMEILLFERLIMYLDCADNVVNLEYHEIYINGEIRSQREWIGIMIEMILKMDDLDKECTIDSMTEKRILQKDLWIIWANVNIHMWW